MAGSTEQRNKVALDDASKACCKVWGKCGVGPYILVRVHLSLCPFVCRKKAKEEEEEDNSVGREREKMNEQTIEKNS